LGYFCQANLINKDKRQKCASFFLWPGQKRKTEMQNWQIIFPFGRSYVTKCEKCHQLISVFFFFWDCLKPTLALKGGEKDVDVENQIYELQTRQKATKRGWGVSNLRQ